MAKATSNALRERGAFNAKASPPPGIYAIDTNISVYGGQAVPRYEKFEISFQVTTVARNLQLPYDDSPPAGVTPAVGISVDAHFTPDNWQTVYTQPAFLYQEFWVDVREGQEWFYPRDRFRWKVRFAPPSRGSWQFRLVARDAGGMQVTAPQSFEVAASQRRGFVRVSQSDRRYFEWEDGTYFPSLGYNMNFDQVSWTNPVLDNEVNFQAMGANGVHLARIWLSQWGIYGPSWNPWNSTDPVQHGTPVPYSGLTFRESYGDSEVSMAIRAADNPCMFIGSWKARPAVHRHTNYRIRVRFKTAGLEGPFQAGEPYGFLVKTGGWLGGEQPTCTRPDSGTPITARQSRDSDGWQILEGTLNSGTNDFLPLFYLVMENVTDGVTYVDEVWIEEDLGNGSFGPNIVSKPWMAHHLYMEQRNSFAFDRLLALADEHDVYLKVVIGEKMDWIMNRIDFDGRPIAYDERCDDVDPQTDPQACPGNVWFYGDYRRVTKVRWLQQAWWRYLQARWGYSTQIHSWELLNEGDPTSTRHYALADEFGAFMRQFAPNHHLVTTSFWHSFPRDAFWTNPGYEHVDYADVHRYVTLDDPYAGDAALATYAASMAYGQGEPHGIGKPLMRGETGFVERGSGPPLQQLRQDVDGLWLHNFLWGSLNAGGLIESYWYAREHIYGQNGSRSSGYDHRPLFRPFANFVWELDLNGGGYAAAVVQTSANQLRAWGQRDAANDRAHLWIQNSAHRRRNVVEGQAIAPASGDVVLSGVRPSSAYQVQWWDTWQANRERQVVHTEVLQSDARGVLVLSVMNLSRDVAVMVTGLTDGTLHAPAIPGVMNGTFSVCTDNGNCG